MVVDWDHNIVCVEKFNLYMNGLKSFHIFCYINTVMTFLKLIKDLHIHIECVVCGNSVQHLVPFQPVCEQLGFESWLH